VISMCSAVAYVFAVLHSLFPFLGS
jgi:hypothetical protein